MQKILIIGYLGRDPELKYTPQGAVIAQFSIASSERSKDKNGELQERTEWFAIKTLGRTQKSPENTFTRDLGSTWRVGSVPNPGTTRKPEQELQRFRLCGQDRVPGLPERWQQSIHAGRVSRRTHILRRCPLLDTNNPRRLREAGARTFGLRISANEFKKESRHAGRILARKRLDPRPQIGS